MACSRSMLDVSCGLNFVSSFSACARHARLEQGQLLHTCFIELWGKFDLVVETALITMYTKCHSLEDASNVFTRMPERDVVAWNAMIAGYVQHGYAQVGLQLFHQFCHEGWIPDRVSYLNILDACGSECGLAEGKHVHCWVLHSAFALNITVTNALINMYHKCRSIKDAHDAFDKMQERDVISWTSIIAILVQHNYSNDALHLFQQMQVEGEVPNKVTCINILSACANVQALMDGKRMHAVIISWQFEFDIILGNALLNMYAKCCCVGLARDLFQTTRTKDVVTWNVMIGLDPYCSFRFFKQMQMEGLIPNKGTLAGLLSSCFGLMSLPCVKEINVCIIGSGLDRDVGLVTGLVSAYGKSAAVEDAQRIFDEMVMHDTILWNAIISAYTQTGLAKCAFQLFYQRLLQGMLPDQITFVSMLDACNSEATVCIGKQLHVFVKGLGFETDILVSHPLLHMYARCQRLEEAQEVFHTMPKQDIVSWNALIVAYVQGGEPNCALQLFEELLLEGIIPDEVTFSSLLSAYNTEAVLAECRRMHARIMGSNLSNITIQNALVSMYGKCGSWEEAQSSFGEISEPDVVSWNAVISAYVLCNQGEKALLAYSVMKQSVVVNKFTVISLLSAYVLSTNLVEAREFHAYIVTVGLELDTTVANGLVNMYGKCGNLNDARVLFDKMERHDVVSWNAIIAVYAHHGQADVALEFFWKMQLDRLMPDKITLVGILSACSHVGFVAECCWMFSFMTQNYHIARTMDHYNCIVDLIGRAGRLHEIENVILSMPFEPKYESWMTLLGACSKHSDVRNGEFAANFSLTFEPEKSAPFVVLSNIYAAAGRWDDVIRIRDMMKMPVET